MHRVWKELLAPGAYWVSDRETGEEHPVEFSPEDVRLFHETGKALLAQGFPMPCPLDHDDKARPMDATERAAWQTANNTGWVSDSRLNPDGSWDIQLDIDGIPGIADADVPRVLQERIKYVSPQLLPRLTIGNGSTFTHGLQHVALTCQPIFLKQKPFGTTAAALSQPAPAAPAILFWKTYGRPACLSMADRLGKSPDPVSAPSLYPASSAPAAGEPVKPVSLSQGAKMAEEHDEPGKKKKPPFGEETAPETPDPVSAAPEEPVNPDAATTPTTPTAAVAPDAPVAAESWRKCAAEIARELESEGMVLPAHTDTVDQWLEHCLTSIRTMKKTRDGNPDEPEEPDEPERRTEEPPVAARPEPEIVSMSQFSGLQKEHAELREQLAVERLAKRLTKIDQLEKAGVSPARCKRWRETFEAKQLSLAGRTPDPAVQAVIAEMDAMEEAYAEKIRMSLAAEEKAPAWASWKPSEDSQKRGEEAGDELAAMAGAPSKRK
jgi:hypothetical protein